MSYITEQQLKELHMVYEMTLNRKKILHYESQRMHPQENSDLCRRILNKTCCCLTKYMPTLDYVR